MPLAPKYTWTETDVAIEVTVEVPGVSRSKADVFATDAFLKVNSPPYLFALDLAKDVDDTRSSATILPGKVVFTLFKVGQGRRGDHPAARRADSRSTASQLLLQTPACLLKHVAHS